MEPFLAGEISTVCFPKPGLSLGRDKGSTFGRKFQKTISSHHQLPSEMGLKDRRGTFGRKLQKTMSSHHPWTRNKTECLLGLQFSLDANRLNEVEWRCWQWQREVGGKHHIEREPCKQRYWSGDIQGIFEKWYLVLSYWGLDLQLENNGK